MKGKCAKSSLTMVAQIRIREGDEHFENWEGDQN